MSEIKIEAATLQDNEGVCELCRIPMVGDISLSMEREPDYFISAGIQNQETGIYVCRQVSTKKIVGMFSIGKRMVFDNRVKVCIRYLCDLRIHPEFQKSLLLVRMSKFIKANKLLDENELAHAMVFSENKTMTDLIGKAGDELLKKFSLLKFYLGGNYCSYMISLGKKRRQFKSDLLIRKAGLKDVKLMQEFFEKEAPNKQWYPCYDFSLLANNYYHGLKLDDFYLAFKENELCGITGVWDQRKFKQTKVNSYSKSLKFVRPFVNGLAKLTKGFHLPDVGEKLNYFMIHTILTKDNDCVIFRNLVDRIYQDNFNTTTFQYFLCGLDKDDPLGNIFSDFKPKRIIKGFFYQVSFNTNMLGIPQISRPFYQEAARI